MWTMCGLAGIFGPKCACSSEGQGVSPCTVHVWERDLKLKIRPSRCFYPCAACGALRRPPRAPEGGLYGFKVCLLLTVDAGIKNQISNKAVEIKP